MSDLGDLSASGDLDMELSGNEDISGGEEEEVGVEEEEVQDSEEQNVPTDRHGHVTRLMIKKIRLHNFKSYAGTKEIGPFHHRFSAIVGPNGSGKSNLIDALLFVFGYRTKKLRLNKINELIHNSNHGSGLEFASVEIEFQQVIDTNLEREEYEVVPDSEILLKRIATKDNKSSYFLNDKKSTWKSVRELLMGHQIDLANNRFLILQGEVELISQMKPIAPTAHEDGLLEYIEDIIGSNRLIEEIEKAVDQLEVFNTERAAQLNRVKAIEHARDSLEGPKKEAEKYIGIEGDIIDNQAVLAQLQALSQEAKIEDIIARKAPLEEKLEKLRDSVKEKRDLLAKVEKEYETKRSEHGKIAKELEVTKNEFYKFERKREKLKQDRNHHKKSGNTLATQIEKAEKKLAELGRAAATAETDLGDAQKKIAQLVLDQEKQEEELEQIQKSIRGETAAFREEVEKEKTKLMPKQKAVNDLKAKLDIAQSEFTLLEEKGNAGQRQLSEAQQSLAQVSERAGEATEQIAQIQGERTEAEARLPALRKELNGAQEEEKKLTYTIREKEAKYEQSLRENQENTSRDKILNACLHLRDQNGLGVLGRLGNLGAIDSKYDVAISTACRELDSIVVETYQDAQQCILHMKKHSLGRARFIILQDQQRLASEMNRMKGNTPEGAPRLFDLVRTDDPALLPVFYFALRDTLVASDLQQAKRLAYGKTRFRVVTTMGNIIDKAGTVTGGGNSVSKGGMRSKLPNNGLSKREMGELKLAIESTRSLLHTIRQRISKLREEEDKLSEIIRGADHRLTKLQMEEVAMRKHEKELKIRIPELKKQSSNTSNANDTERMSELKKELGDLQIPLHAALADAAKYEERIADLQSKIMDIGGLPLKMKQAEVDATISMIDDTSKEETRHKVKIKTSKKKVANLTGQIAEQKTERGQALTLYEERKLELEELVQQGKLVAEKFNAAQEILEQTEADLETASESYQEIKTFVSKFQTKELDYTNQIDTLNQALEQVKGGKEHFVQKLKEFENKKALLYEINPELAKPLLLLESEEIEVCDPKMIKQQIQKLQEKLKAMNPNMGSIVEYKAKNQEFVQRSAELEAITTSRDDQQNHCKALRKKRFEEFMAGFAVINTKLKEMYRMITLEGDAVLEFVDSIDPFSEGIIFSVRPPKKSWKNIANLSGGEKTLSSLALVFALHHYKPTPLYFMDEIDAALDFKNVSIVAHYIKERTKNAQFIIISLRNNMFELADHLIGIYKPENCTQSVTINPKKHTIGLAPASTLL